MDLAQHKPFQKNNFIDCYTFRMANINCLCRCERYLYMYLYVYVNLQTHPPCELMDLMVCWRSSVFEPTRVCAMCSCVCGCERQCVRLCVSDSLAMSQPFRRVVNILNIIVCVALWLKCAKNSNRQQKRCGLNIRHGLCLNSHAHMHNRDKYGKNRRNYTRVKMFAMF